MIINRKAIFFIKLIIIFFFISLTIHLYRSKNIYLLNVGKNSIFNCELIQWELPFLIEKRKGFNINGTIICSHKIKQMNIKIFDKDQFEYEENSNIIIRSTKIYLSHYHNHFDFEKIPSGEKILNIILLDNKKNKYIFQNNFTVLGISKEPKHMTKYCNIKTSNPNYNISNIIDSSYNNNNNCFNNGTIIIKVPDSKIIDGILLKFYYPDNNYSIKSYSQNGTLLNYFNGLNYNMFHKYFKLNYDTKEVLIFLYTNYPNYIGICTLRIYEMDKVGISVERWKPTEKCDLMVISAHRDDELLFFGGTIPYYSFVKKKKTCTVYMCGEDIRRIREAHASQWSMGINNYPIFMGFVGGFHNGINGTINDWGGEEIVLSKIVEKIRKYKPDVIVTHDFEGEYGHPTHKTVPYLVVKAINLVGEKNKFIDTYKKYGIHEVKKLYIHLYKKNQVILNWNNREESLYNKTPFEVACIGYDKYYSQHNIFGMSFERVTKFPNNQYGLFYSKVGSDIKKDDFFENIQ